jgi:hypothetical protein
MKQIYPPNFFMLSGIQGKEKPVSADNSKWQVSC